MLKRLAVLTVLTLMSGCAAGKALRAELPPLQLDAAAPAPRILTENPFAQDRPASVSEAELKSILAAPVFLEAEARVGVVPVAGRYELDGEVPMVSVPGVLAASLEGSSLFLGASEVSTDWPSGRGVAGLRELAARYRTEYLVLYRQRFVEDRHLNPWAVGYATLLGALFLPANTLQTSGVLEATFFDVKTGTILFTVFERVQGSAEVNNWQTDRKLGVLQGRLLSQAAQKLANEVVAKCRRLDAARPSPPATEALSIAAPR